MNYFKKFLSQVRNAPVPGDGATQFKNTMSTILKTFGVETESAAQPQDVLTSILGFMFFRLDGNQ
jgi:hypothetical protein